MARESNFELEVQEVVLQIELLRSDSRLRSLIILSGVVHTGVKVCKMNSEICRLMSNLSFNLCAILSVCCVVIISGNRKKSEMEVSTDLVCCY